MLLLTLAVLGIPLLVALIAFLLIVAAALSNVENLGYGKALLIVLLELVIAVPLLAGGYFLLDRAGYSLARLGSAPPGEFLTQLGAWGLLVLATGVAGVILYWLLIPTGLFRAVRIWVLRALVLTLVGALVGGLGLVGLAVWQIVAPRVA